MSNISETINKEPSNGPCGPDVEAERLAAFIGANPHREIVVVQGLGFVGTAMAAALARARDQQGNARFAVIGIDLDNPEGARKIAAIRRGESPIVSSDAALASAIHEAYRIGNLTATSHVAALALASIVVVSVNLDVEKTTRQRAGYEVHDLPFRRAIAAIADHIGEDTLVIVETTVPPGTTEALIAPMIAEGLRQRQLDPSRTRIGHSYERVMPGPNYLASITDYYRVFAGIDEASSLRTRIFLESFINTQQYPLFELENPTASEMAKVLENSFRTTNIALIQEWSNFAQHAGINLFQVIEAIRARPTHRNIMSPGFGVGGYCLTKDSLLADWAAQTFSGGKARLEMAIGAVAVNDAMPLHTLDLIKQLISNLDGRRIVILGVSYLNDVADTRFSPTEILYDACVAEGAFVIVHDPLVAYWIEKDIEIDCRMDSLAGGCCPDIAVFAVRHREYLALNATDITRLFPTIQAVIDANNVLSDEAAAALVTRGVRVAGVGKGHWRHFPTRKT
jgi:nucleotide sugar dehydrogenase